MNLLRKMLWIVVITVFAENAEGLTSLDLPNDTPGLRIGNTQDKTINHIPNKECIHIIIPNTPASQARGVAEAMNNMDGNIYFPIDGHQPTTEEAVEYSCANVDAYDENSPITKWYMMMFGVIPYKGNGTNDDDYIKTGWNSDGSNAQCIIFFDQSISDKYQEDDPNNPRAKIGRLTLFKREFRKIASNPIGRVLLYRILIEIRRLDQNKQGCVSSEVLCHISPVLRSRNSNRSIKICHGMSSTFKSGMHIAVCFSPEDRNVISNRKNNNSTEIIRYPRDVDCDLFHEMLHWFHSLKDHKRYGWDTEKSTYSNTTFPEQFVEKNKFMIKGQYEDKSEYKDRYC